jgi:hypothetical protein
MSERNDDMRREYDLNSLSGRVRGKYHDRYVKESNVVVIDPDLTEAFPNAKAVNDALRASLDERGPAATGR